MSPQHPKTASGGSQNSAPASASSVETASSTGAFAGAAVHAGVASGLPVSARPASGRVPPPPPPPSNRYRRDPRLAAIYESELAPVWTEPFGRLLLSQVQPLRRPRATLLDVMCHTGFPSLELLRRFPEARVFAVDPSSALLDIARQRAGAQTSRRIFFRTEPTDARLPFDESVYDLVMSNLGLYDATQPRQLLKDMARVAQPGAQVLATMPIAGSFSEFYTLLAALLQDRPKEASRLRAHLWCWPDAATVLGWASEAGLVDAKLVVEPFTLLFAGGADLFFSPVIEYGPLTAWKTVLGDRGPEMQAAFAQLKDAIDLYCRGEGDGAQQLLRQSQLVKPMQRPMPMPLALTVRAACLVARKPMPALPSDDDATPPPR